MKKLKWMLTILLILAAFLTGCGSKTSEQNKNKDILTIYTTVYPLKYFTERIGDKYVTVDTIYPPGADEHTFEPSQKDMMKLADSDLFVYIGLGLEGFVNSAAKTLKNEDVTLLAAGENVHFDENEDEHAAHEEEGHTDDDDDDAHSDDNSDHEGDGHNHTGIDPHVWLDPVYSKDLAESIKNELAKKMPKHKDVFEANYQALVKDLEDLDSKFEQTIHNAKQKEIIVAHAAYGYWEARYGLEQISVTGLSTTNEPSQKELKNIIKQAKSHNLKYIFFEQNVTSKLTEIVKNELNAEPLTLHNLSVLTDEDISKERNYLTIMEDNLKGLEKSLNH